MYVKARFPCACCGYLTISEIAETCEVCYWEESCYQEKHIDDTGGPNHVSLRDARENFKRIGACDEDAVAHIRPPAAHELPTGRKNACACCGYLTISELHQQCRVCAWRQSAFHEAHPNHPMGTNGTSLITARERFQKSGVSDEEYRYMIRPPEEAEKPDPPGLSA